MSRFLKARTRRIFLVPALALMFLATLVASSPAANADGPTSLGRSSWEMYRPPAVIPTPGFSGPHGAIPLYAYAPAIPDGGDAGWGAAPNGDTVAFGHGNFSRIDEAGYGCFQAADFTFFQTFVDIPTGTVLSSFTIAFSGMDDGSRITIFNSLYPSGLVIEGSYVFLGGSGTSDLAPYVVDGETNRVVITQVDDCPVGNTLQSATVVLNGTVIVPNSPPTLTGDAFNVTVVEGQTAVNGGTYSDPDGDPVTLEASLGDIVDNGDGTWSWSYDTTDGPLTQFVGVSATDPEGASQSAAFVLEVLNAPPFVASDTDLVTVDEGVVATMTGTYGDPGDDTVSLFVTEGIIVDNGDGTWSWSFDSTDGPDESQVVTITATDEDGESSSVNYNLTVLNVAPANLELTVSPDVIDEGESVTAEGTFDDPGTLDTHTVVISWGDGSPDQTINLGPGVLSFSATHQYPDDNPTGTSHDIYAVQILSLTDKDGGVGGVSLGGNIFLTGHDPDFHAQGSFEPGAKNLMREAVEYVRDGNSLPMLWVESRLGVPGGHRLGRNGLTASGVGLTEGVDFVWMDAAQLNGLDWSSLSASYSAIGVASDFGGTLSDAEKDVLIAHKADIAAFVSAGGGLLVLSECSCSGWSNGGDPGKNFAFIPINVTSAGTAQPAYAVTAFGQAPPFNFVNSDVQSPSHSHFDDDFGLNVVSFSQPTGQVMTLAGNVIITDEAITVGVPVRVNNVAPVVTAADDSVHLGTVFSLGSTFSDAGVPDTHTATIDWGDSSPVEAGAVTEASGSGTVSGSHTYAAIGVYTVTVTVTDDDGGEGVATATVEVFNNAPTIAVDAESVTVDEGGTATTTGTYNDPDGDSVTLVITEGIIVDNGDGTWSWTRNPLDGPADSSTVTVIVTDAHGAIGITTFELVVLNVAPSVVLDASPAAVFLGESITLSAAFSDPAESADDAFTYEWDLNGDGAFDDASGSTAYGSVPTEIVSLSLRGTYDLGVRITDKDGGSTTETITVEVLNRLPDCTSASASVLSIWPPNHKMVSVSVLGVTDADGDAVSIVIDSIWQDEPTDTNGDGNTAIDGAGVGTDTAEVRAERTGDKKVPGNGRVYHIGFTADDGNGGSCSGEVTVGVPHDQGKNTVLVDDGALYDSTVATP